MQHITTTSAEFKVFSMSTTEKPALMKTKKVGSGEMGRVGV